MRGFKDLTKQPKRWLFPIMEIKAQLFWTVEQIIARFYASAMNLHNSFTDNAKTGQMTLLVLLLRDKHQQVRYIDRLSCTFIRRSYLNCAKRTFKIYWTKSFSFN